MYETDTIFLITEIYLYHHFNAENYGQYKHSDVDYSAFLAKKKEKDE